MTGKSAPVVVVRLDLGTPRLRLWCDTCLTPARYEVDLLRLTRHGVTVLRTVTGCRRCEESSHDR